MSPQEAGWRQVLTVAAVIVVGVLAFQLVSMLFPAVADAFGKFPTIIVLLIAVTLGILALALRAQRR